MIHYIFPEATADSIPIGAYLYALDEGVGLDMQARIQGGQNTGRPDGLPVLDWGGGVLDRYSRQEYRQGRKQVGLTAYLSCIGGGSTQEQAERTVAFIYML